MSNAAIRVGRSRRAFPRPLVRSPRAAPPDRWSQAPNDGASPRAWRLAPSPTFAWAMVQVLVRSDPRAGAPTGA